MLSRLFASAVLVTRLLPVTTLIMSATPGTWSPAHAGVLWDVDGTLVESTKLAFDATNEVLVAEGGQVRG